MVDGSPDYRGDKSESIEGRGKARGRWYAFYDRIPEDILVDAYPSTSHSVDDLDDDLRDAMAEDALEQSELIGFWVAWHLAGGFAALEQGGWHRATIFRKVKRFRAAFGVHPDEFQFPWITLDLDTAWSNQLSRRLAMADGPEE